MNKNLLFFLFFFLSLTTLSACSTDEEVSYEIIVSPSENMEPILDADGDNFSIEFYASADWKIDVDYSTSSNTDWIKVTPVSGNKGVNTLLVSVTDNPLPVEREATINISSGTVRKNIVVKQKKSNKGYTNFNAISIDASGDVFSVKIVGYDDFFVESSQEWCDVAKVVDDTGIYVNISATTNDQETRYAQVTLKSKSGKELYQISVKQYSFIEQENVQSYMKEIKTNERSSLFLIFTATWCPFTPIMQNAFELASDLYSKNIELVNVHVADSELYCELTPVLSTYYMNNSTPTGILDGRTKITNTSLDAEIISQSLLDNLTEGETLIHDGAQIQCVGGYNADKIIVNIKLNNLVVSSYSLQVWLLENGLEARQEDLINGSHTNYIHNNILIGTLSSILGDDFIISNNSSSYKEFTYTYDIPSSCNKDNLHLLVILSKKVDINNTTFNFPYYVDNCTSMPIVDYTGGKNTGGNENIIPGEDIEL